MAALAGDADASVNTIDRLLDLEFGSVVGDADLVGTASIPSSANSKSVAGGAFDLGGTVRRGRFRLNGPNSSAYNCTLPGQVQLSSGANTIVVDSFVTDNPLSGTLSSQGRQTIMVGGTLQITAGQPAGFYTGNLTLDCGTAQATISVTGTLGTAISISSTANLEFGRLAPTGAAGTVTVTPAGTRSSTNVDLVGGTVGAAGFTVTGETNANYAISLPTNVILTGPSGTMTVDTFNDDAGANPRLTGGSDPFNVGATLNVGGNQALGGYTGTFAVTVNYN